MQDGCEGQSKFDLDLDGLDSEQLDDLFETYGEVVKEESVPTPAPSELDDDAESLALQVYLHLACGTGIASMGWHGMGVRDSEFLFFKSHLEEFDIHMSMNHGKNGSNMRNNGVHSQKVAVALAEVENDVKASEIQVLCVKPLVYWTRFCVIATGFSRPQVDAIGQRMRNMAEERFNRIPHGDLKPNAWTLLDFGDVVVHIFYPKDRSFYNLE